jgi:tellurite resistance protein TerC
VDVPIPLWFEITSIIVMVAVIGFDLVLAYRRPHIPSSRESALWIGFYVGLALIFAVLLFVVGGATPATQFVAGWLTEYSLSIDNLFVFVIIMARFAVPRTIQQEVLMVGIIIALLLRLIFILLGVALIANFGWIFYFFGAFLIYTAIHQIATHGKDDDEDSEGRMIGFLRRHIRITPGFDGAHITTRIDGQRMLTPVLLVFVALGATDLIFALDSIPAIFGITQDAFLVFAANVFALMGLRQLYFLLGTLINRLAYLAYGIAAILIFIGLKLVFHALHTNQVPFINGGEPVEWAPEISTLASLVFIIVAMGVAIVASLIKMRMDAGREESGAS